MIFCYALPPRWLLSGSGLQSMATYPNDILSVDLRMKHSLLSVCKSWNQVGTELLYESVALRRILQLPVFVRALDGRQGLAALVKRLDINCFVPQGYYQLHDTEVRRILALCPNLSHLGFSPPFRLPGIPCTLPALSFSITSLECNGLIPYPAIVTSLLQLSDKLKSLTLTIPSTYDEGHPVLVFGSLENLYLRIEEDSMVSPSKWLIPNLRRLWLYNCSKTDRQKSKIQELTDAYGSGLTFLGLFPKYSLPALRDLLDGCPALEHLALQGPEAGDVLSEFVASRTVKFVDVFARWKDPPGKLVTAEMLRAFFPAIRGCRNLGAGIFEFRDIPLAIPKRRVREKTPPATRFDRTHDDDYEASDCDDIEESDDEKNEEQPSDPESESEEDNEVPATVIEFTNPASINGEVLTSADDYDLPCANGSRDTEENSDADSCVTVSEDGGYQADEFYLGEDWEVGHVEALGLFDRIHNAGHCGYAWIAQICILNGISEACFR
ncbi:hypothetical protein DFH08DRAFT_691748 [Mycena albidolilacea]|uniref:Uncharacterized protein n=1 Tax=Mycena albidolilacea TaxID=1033008 RepID=A0AAD7EYN0_9AGAR|nr:hypothetical protein DFH08DRAFT_691748 [Mycena albidolilacea]